MMRGSPTGRRARWVLLGVGLVFALVVGECLSRVVVRGGKGVQAPPSATAEMLRFSDDIHQGWELRPAGLDHNAAGFRGRLVTRKKPTGVRRIAMVGDSVTYGIGVTADRTFSAVLGQLLNRDGETTYEVMNFGVPGYGTHQVRRLVENRVLAYEPDLVVMTFTPDDVETTPVVIEIGGEMCLFQNPLEGDRVLDSKVHWLVFRHSHLYRLLYKGLALVVGPSVRAGGEAYVSPEVAWGNVASIAELVRRCGADFLLVLSPPVLPMCDADGRPAVTPAVITRPLAVIRELADESDFAVLDLGPLFARNVGRLKLSPQDHEHFNALGHRLVAEELFRTIG